MTLVAFSGRLGSGKDTAGDRLAAMASGASTHLSFARPLKESAAALLDIPVDDWEIYKNDPEAKIYLTVGYEKLGEDALANDIEGPKVVREFTAREFLQRYGTESHRDVFGDNFWVEQALTEYRYGSRAGLTYVSDCRFDNEAQAVRSLGGVVIGVIGPEDNTGTHASESPLPESLIDFYIDNAKRDDDFVCLDSQLVYLAHITGIPLK